MRVGAHGRRGGVPQPAGGQADWPQSSLREEGVLPHTRVAAFIADLKLADGSTVRSSRFLLRSLTVGCQRLTNVPASIGSPMSVPLLGQSVLKRLVTWSIDNQRTVLKVTAPAAGAQSAQGPESTRPDGRATSSLPKSPTTLVVSPPRLSSQVAQMGQRLTVELEAINTSKRPGHGIVMLNYSKHLVSFMALDTTGQKTVVQLPTSNTEVPDQTVLARTAYQLLWSSWPV